NAHHHLPTNVIARTTSSKNARNQLARGDEAHHHRSSEPEAAMSAPRANAESVGGKPYTGRTNADRNSARRTGSAGLLVHRLRCRGPSEFGITPGGKLRARPCSGPAAPLYEPHPNTAQLPCKPDSFT